MNLKFKTFSLVILASASTGMYAQTHTKNTYSICRISIQRIRTKGVQR